MRQILAALIFILGLVAAFYFGGWLMFIKPIIGCCKAFDGGTLTAMMIGTTVIKCIFASVVASICVWVGGVIAAVLNR